MQPKTRKLRTSINRNGIVVLGHAPDGKNEYLVLFKANDRCTVHRSVAYRVRNFIAASRCFNQLADKTEN